MAGIPRGFALTTPEDQATFSALAGCTGSQFGVELTYATQPDTRWFGAKAFLSVKTSSAMIMWHLF